MALNKENTGTEKNNCLNCKFMQLTLKHISNASGFCTRYPQFVGKRGKDLFYDCGEWVKGASQDLDRKPEVPVEKPPMRSEMPVMNTE